MTTNASSTPCSADQAFCRGCGDELRRVDPVRDHLDPLGRRALLLETQLHRLADRDDAVGAPQVERDEPPQRAEHERVLEPLDALGDLGEDVLADDEERHAEAPRDERARCRRRWAGRSCRGRGRAARRGAPSARCRRGSSRSSRPAGGAASGRRSSSARARSRTPFRISLDGQVVPMEVPGDDRDVVVVGERLAELREELRGRLDPRPVVLVEDEDPRPGARGHDRGRVDDRRPRTLRACAAPLRILLASPAYWPAHAFGGPVVVARELVSRLVRRGHDGGRRHDDARRRRRAPGAHGRASTTVDGARVTYLATPLRYRWMGITPTLPLAAAPARAARRRARHRLPRPGHDRRRGVVPRARRSRTSSSPSGMFRPRLRKVRLKRAFDATLARGVAVGRDARDRLVAARARRRRRVRRRPRARPPARQRASRSPPPTGESTRSTGVVPAGAPVVLYVGRIAAEKGVEHLLEAARRLPEAHVVLAGPDDRHGTMDAVRAALASPRTAGASTSSRRRPARRTTSTAAPTSSCSPRAARTSGSSPPRRPPSGRPWSSPTARGVAASFGEGEALVVPYDAEATVEAVTGSSRDDGAARALVRGRAPRPRARSTWDAVADAAGRDLPRGARRALTPSARRRRGARPEQVLDARLVAPAADDLARGARPPRGGASGSAASARSASPAAAGVVGGDERPVPPVLEQVEGGADPVGEDERQPARGRLVDDDAPRLVAREEREDVRDGEPLDDPLPGECRAGARAARRASRASASSALPLRPAAREDAGRGADRPPPRRRGRACRAPSRARAARPRARRRRRARAPPRRAELVPAAVRARRPLRRTPRRRSCRRRRRSAPDRRRARASTRARACPTTRTSAAPRTTARDDGALDGPPPARPRVALVALDEQDVRHAAQAAPRDRRLRREGAPPGDDDDAPGAQPAARRRRRARAGTRGEAPGRARARARPRGRRRDGAARARPRRAAARSRPRTARSGRSPAAAASRSSIASGTASARGRPSSRGRAPTREAGRSHAWRRRRARRSTPAPARAREPPGAGAASRRRARHAPAPPGRLAARATRAPRRRPGAPRCRRAAPRRRRRARERVGRVGPAEPGGQLAPGADAPRELGALARSSPGASRAICRERDPPLAVALELRAAASTPAPRGVR